MQNRTLRASRVRRILWTLFAVVLTVSMMLVCSTPASAEAEPNSSDTSSQTTEQGNDAKTDAQGTDGANNVTSDSSQPTGSNANGSNSDLKGADATDSTAPSDTTSAPADSSNGSTASSPDSSTGTAVDSGNVANSGESNSQQLDNAGAATKAANDPSCTAAGVTNVTTWDDMKTTIDRATGNVTICVTGTKLSGADITIPTGRNVTIINAKPAPTAADSDPLFAGRATDGALFTVKGNLTFKSLAADQRDKDGKLTAYGAVTYSDATAGTLADVEAGGTVTFDDGVFSNNNTNASLTDPADGGTIARNYGGTVQVNGGTFTGNESRVGGSVFKNWNATGGISIADGWFEGNKSTEDGQYHGGGVVRMEFGSLDISGGTFTGNETDASQGNTGGGVIWAGTKSVLKISGGEFANNVTNGVGGGAIYVENGSQLTISGTASFTGNKHIKNGCQGTIATCGAGSQGGGAVYSTGSTLSIMGPVSFTGNQDKEWGAFSGGGAVYAQGTLWLKNDSEGNGPKFDGNWSGIADTQFVDGGKVPMGAAGGAVFLQNGNSKAYLMGGTFTNNSSGYLGGGIYTEEGSITYISKAVAHGNTAGHFGGGLWLCPSGQGQASKGGNIALFDNSVDKSIDTNEWNDVPNPANGNTTEAGDDFAIMNPAGKNHGKSTFELMNTWFTNRANKAVDWYYDGKPLRLANGFGDSYQSGRSEDHTGKINDGLNSAVTAENNRYEEGSSANTAIDDTEYANHVKELKLSQDDADASNGYYTTGVALKSVVTDPSLKNSAKQSAFVTISGNKARLSGGAFGTNGDVIFSTPYTATWSKVNSSDKKLGGSRWLLTTTNGGPLNKDFDPSVCIARANGDDSDWKQGKCWKMESDGNGGVKYSAYILDNQDGDNPDSPSSYVGFDNNPESGGFDINNLASGTYTLTEDKAPTGYQQSTDPYTFTVSDAQAQWSNDSGVDEVDKHIENTPLKGVSWDKVDANTVKPVKNSSWTVTKLDEKGNPVGDSQKVTDCTDDECATKTGKYDDTNPAEGSFTINPGETGKFKLEETGVPSGYWTPANVTYYFEIVQDSNDFVKIYKDFALTQPVTGEATNSISNKRPQVAWSKVAAEDNSKLLAGSEWQIRGPLTSTGGTVDGKTISVPVEDCVSKPGIQNSCESHDNEVDENGTITAYADVDHVAGQFRVIGLTPAPSGQTYKYELTETQAPDGYAKSDKTYTFEIGSSDTAFVPIKVGEKNVDGNLIVNAKKVVALPLTGGMASRSWMLFGGAFAAGAAVILALINEYRKRKGLSN